MFRGLSLYILALLTYLYLYSSAAFLVGMMELGLAFIQPDNLCLLIGMLRPFTFNVTIDKVRFEYIISVFVSYLSHLVVVPFSSQSSELGQL